MRLIICMALVLGTVLPLSMGVNGTLAGRPTDEVKSVVDEVIRLLGDPGLKGPAQRQKRRQLIKEVIDRRFDYEEMARRSLGTTWGRLNRSQQKEFVRLFGDLLEASYATRLKSIPMKGCNM